MKYGEQLERESVPQWSLHNLDYNSLKHEIKVHTTRDQATAIAIPGHQDASLLRFENALYNELCHQHSRVDLFVSSKADEISRRMDHLESNIKRWVAKYSEEPATASVSLKRQRRFAKYERELLNCGQDIHALSRFCRAQVTAFRKILKKYKKWTGSAALSARFSDDVLNSFKSFTRRDFSPLQQRHDDILSKLRAAAPQLSEPSSPESDETPTLPSLGSSSTATRQPRIEFDPLPPSEMTPHTQIKYWNEYDDGSEAAEDDYAIYIDPEAQSSFPGLGYVHAIVALPYEKVRGWFKLRQSPERTPLLGSNTTQGHGTNGTTGYTSTSVDSEEEGEGGYASSDGIPTEGYVTHYASTFPSVNEQKMLRHRERALLWGTTGCFAASFVLISIAAILISAGKRKLHVEVDVGVSIGVMLSLLCACFGLGMTLYRNDRLSVLYRLVVWASFIASCLLNGMLLILVIDNAP